MFYYYGGKRRLAQFYSAPKHDVIIEPFAGSAAYALRHLDPETRGRTVERVILVEKDPRVCELWARLLAMDPADLKKYPIPKAGDRTSDFLIMTSACSNRIARTETMTVTKRMPDVIERMFRQIAAVLPYAKGHVEVIEGDYTKAPDLEGTWFIDPPYWVNGRGVRVAQSQGKGYAADCDSSSMDYPALAEWCKARKGQVIVCEQAGAKWLPFEHLRWARDSLGNKASEVVWMNAGHSAAAPGPVVDPEVQSDRPLVTLAPVPA